jgi:predicted transcriptional regulator
MLWRSGRIRLKTGRLSRFRRSKRNGTTQPTLQIRLAPWKNTGYPKSIARVTEKDFFEPTSLLDDEDEETLAAIDKGIRDADAGRTLPMEEVRRLLPKWIIASSSRNKR